MCRQRAIHSLQNRHSPSEMSWGREGGFSTRRGLLAMTRESYTGSVEGKSKAGPKSRGRALADLSAGSVVREHFSNGSLDIVGLRQDFLLENAIADVAIEGA